MPYANLKTTSRHFLLSLYESSQGDQNKTFNIIELGNKIKPFAITGDNSFYQELMDLLSKEELIRTKKDSKEVSITWRGCEEAKNFGQLLIQAIQKN